MAVERVVVVREDHFVTRASPGPQGPPGPPGPPGAPGGDVQEHIQSSPASDFTVTTNLGRRPAAVWMEGADGSQMLVRFDTFTDNSFRVVANSPITGTVYYS